MIYRKNTKPTTESTRIYTQKMPVHKNYINVRHKTDVQYIVLNTISTELKTTSKTKKKSKIKNVPESKISPLKKIPYKPL